MYPLKRKPSKLISKVVIIMIWICGFLFALPMAYAFTFDNVPESYPIPGINNISKFGCYMKKNVAFTLISFGVLPSSICSCSLSHILEHEFSVWAVWAVRAVSKKKSEQKHTLNFL